MTEIKIAVAGFGNVGRSFARFVLDIPAIRIVAIADSSACQKVQSRDQLARLLVEKEQGVRIGASAKEGANRAHPPPEGKTESTSDLVELASDLGASVLVEALPTNIHTGQPGLDLIQQALSKGLNVVTVDKGPMVRGFELLIRTAGECDARLAYTGATGVAIPDEVSGHEVLEIRGVLNGTTNYILTQMQAGAAYDEALAKAQAAGIAEPDPALDVEGWDTACKILILAKTLMGSSASLNSEAAAGVTLEGVVRTGIGPETESLIQVGRDTGRVVRLVGRARMWQGRLRLSVTPKLVGSDSPFYSVSGTSKAAVFRTREHGDVIAEAHSGRQSIAEVIFKDILNVSGMAEDSSKPNRLVF